MRLYDLSREWQSIEERLVQSGGELDEALEADITLLLQTGRDKLEASCCVIRNLEADQAACKREAERLLARAATIGNGIDRLKRLMLLVVDNVFDGRVKTMLFTLWAQNAAEHYEYSLVADADMEKLLPELVRRHDPELNKIALDNARKSGGLPDEIIAQRKDGKRFLRIR